MTERKETIKATTTRVINRGLRLSDLPKVATFKTDQEITFDGGTWGIVDVVIDDIIIVIDEDGGDHELTAARID
jgi:hypothetical protein